ncbi:MAG: DUF3488 and DUF4129 domain-containing transglutaminase family protein [Haloferacaceae archaeon]
MSADGSTADADVTADTDAGVGFRLPALAGVALLTFSYASVLYHVTDVVGGATTMLLAVAGSLALAALLGRYVGVPTAGTVTALLLLGGMAGYVLSVPPGQRALLLSGRVVSDTVALLTGLSVLRLTNAGVWALAVAPGPIVLSWYLAVRRRYVASVGVGGAALGLFVLTGDVTPLTALTGVVGATAAVGLGGMERHGGAPSQLDTLTAVIAAMVVVTATLSIAAAGAPSPVLPERKDPTVESSLVDAQDSVDILGSIRLSPQVRFTVESESGEYWQTATYDRYTGDGWVRTGETEPYDGQLRGPPGESRRVRQRVTARTPLGSLPAAWRPIEVEGEVASSTLVTPQGGIRPEGAVASGESYVVTSRVPQYTTAQLRRAGTDYPDRIEASYLRLPESTPDRVRRLSDEVTANASTPYGKATAIESYLEENKDYSLQVDKPSGSIADSFLFEMESGYCTYYATTMVTMLRSEGVPARFVVGYTTGEENDGEYVVRGLDSHAWVQVYFPDVGWVRFDPTPAAEREAAEQARLAEARGGSEPEPGVDANDTGSTETATTPTPTPTNGTFGGSDSEPGDALESTATTPAADGAAGDGVEIPDLPSRRTLALWAVTLAGAVAVGRRTGATDRIREAVRLRYQPQVDPDTDAVRAYARLETLFERRHRPRRPGETPRAYVESLVDAGADERALAVLDAYERARYGDGVSHVVAARSVAVVDRLTRAATPGLRWTAR